MFKQYLRSAAIGLRVVMLVVCLRTSQSDSTTASADVTVAARREAAINIIIEEAQRASSLNERQQLLREFLERSAELVKDSPESTRIWFLRAVVALELSEGQAGWEAGHALLQRGLGSSENPKVQKLMAALERKKWLEDVPSTAAGQYALGEAFETGQGAPRDSERAINMYREAAERGHAKAQLRLARAYGTGIGVTKDLPQELKWLREAADIGDPETQYLLGAKYEQGEGVPKDLRLAIAWYRKAGDQGFGSAKEKIPLLEGALQVRSAALNNLQAGREFLAENGKKKGVTTLASGVQYQVIRKGKHEKPSTDAAIYVRYRGTLLDGREFDSVEYFPIGPLYGVKGLREALELMPIGAVWKVILPPDLAFGEQNLPNVPPNSVVVYEVERRT
jgi:FKBP-type peptidyl-prolyl cis-trans isomerase FkpA